MAFPNVIEGRILGISSVSYTVTLLYLGVSSEILMIYCLLAIRWVLLSILNGSFEAINDCELSELELMGHQFTWERGRGTTAWIQERLDRAFTSVSWFEEFLLSRLTNLLASSSDHSPILLELDITHKPGYTHRFRFENLWVQEQDFNENLKRWWKSSSDKDLLGRELGKRIVQRQGGGYPCVQSLWLNGEENSGSDLEGE